LSVAETSAEFIALQRALSGRYSLERELGRGGMGIVFLARDVALSRLVAIKLLPPHLAQQSDMRERFLREAQVAAGLFHPNIVPIHLVEQDGELVFFVMAYVQGETLGQRVRRAGPLPPQAVRRIVNDVAWALSYARDKGVIHRDIKPDNILLERPGGRALVADFGIARTIERSGNTAIGEVLGTVEYMSPEQATGGLVDGRSDLYALGATAFFALTGKPPFEASNALAMINQHVNTPAPRIAGLVADLPATLAQAIDRCLAKLPEERFATGEALANAVSESGGGAPTVPPEIRRIIRRIRAASVVMGLLSGSSVVLGFFGPGIARSMSNADPFALTVVGVIAAIGTLRGIGKLLKDARRAIAAGYDESFVQQALLAESRSMIEEGYIEAGPAKPKSVWKYDLGGAPGVLRHEEEQTDKPDETNPILISGRKREKSIRQGPLILGIGVVFTALCIYGRVRAAATGSDKGAITFFLGLGVFFVLSGFLVLAAGPAVGESSPLAALEWGERLLIGRFGRMLFRLARIGTGKRGVTTTAGAPTEVALVAAIDELLSALPKAERARFGDARNIIRALEKDAATLREREGKLSAALARVDMHVGSSGRDDQEKLQGDIESARGKVRQRLATAVAAIESVRLDLLRLHAGVGSADELTADLARARDIAGAVDASVAARRDVDKLLAKH
jgi:predicted Ser/Thr protein kinase